MNILITAFILFILLSFIFSKWDNLALKKLEYKRYLDKERVFVGETVRMTTEITNNKLLFLPWVEVVANIPKEFNFRDQRVTMPTENSGKTYKVVTSLLSFQRIKRHNSIYCSRRGYYTLHDVKLSVGDFLGFAVAEKLVPYQMQLIVYPEIKPLKQLLIPFKNLQGEMSVRRWINPDNIAIIGAREYTSDDSFNTIDWKATSRVGRLYVKKLDFTADPSIVILLNIQTSDIHWKNLDIDLIEKGVDIVASITQKAIDEKVAVGYSSNSYFYGDKHDIFIKPKNDRNQKILIFDSLAKTSYLPTTKIEEFLGNSSNLIDKNSVIILITSYTSDNLITKINRMVGVGYSIKLIMLDKKKIQGLHKDVDVVYSYDLNITYK